MFKLKQFLKNVFKKKPIEKIVKIVPIAGKKCPFCGVDGLFKEKDIYKCEECLKEISSDQFELMESAMILVNKRNHTSGGRVYKIDISNTQQTEEEIKNYIEVLTKKIKRPLVNPETGEIYFNPNELPPLTDEYFMD